MLRTPGSKLPFPQRWISELKNRQNYITSIEFWSNIFIDLVAERQTCFCSCWLAVVSMVIYALQPEITPPNIGKFLSFGAMCVPALVGSYDPGALYSPTAGARAVKCLNIHGVKKVEDTAAWMPSLSQPDKQGKHFVPECPDSGNPLAVARG